MSLTKNADTPIRKVCECIVDVVPNEGQLLTENNKVATEVQHLGKRAVAAQGVGYA